MALFEYKALQSNGSVMVGSLDAGGKQDAIRVLEEKGWTPLKITETSTTPVAASAQKTQAQSKFPMPWKSNKVSFSALEDFTRALASLSAAHVPLSRALTILYKETSNPAAGAKWKELHDLVIDGVSLGAAMGRSPEVFPRVYVAMVEAGETGGFLDVVLEQIADFQAREKEMRAKVLSAMIYPSVLLFLAIAVLIYLLVFFIPRFQTMFESFDAALPLLTQIIIATSNMLRSYGIIIVGALVGVAFFGRKYISLEKHRRTWESLLFRIPVIGALAAKIATARFCRMLGTLLTAGVPLINGLGVARRSLGYQILIDLVSESTERVKKGETLAASLGNCHILFPGSTLEIVSVAEESGRLDKELIRLAGVTESSLDRQLKTAVALVEPMMLFLIAAFIGIIFLGMVIPIFTIQDYIK
jgi:type IV pilus assembly protein PilC